MLRMNNFSRFVISNKATETGNDYTIVFEKKLTYIWGDIYHFAAGL